MNEIMDQSKVKKCKWALGLMSGTSLDGIDAALILTDGEKIEDFGLTLFYPFSSALKEGLESILGCDPQKDNLESVIHNFTKANGEVVMALLAQARLDPSDVCVIGFHGQTLWHRSKRVHGIGATCQVGDASLLSHYTGIDVVHQFRVADIEAGGEGAPLVPVYHQALMASQRESVMCVNIGGIANVTWVNPCCLDALSAEALMAFDVGPGNVLMDQWMMQKAGLPFDEGGKFALQGNVNQFVFKKMLDTLLLDKAPPKSFDRLNFDLKEVQGLSLEDGAATLTGLTAEGIVSAAKFVPAPPQRWILMGGGRYNQALKKCLHKRLLEVVGCNASVLTAEDMAFRGDFIEAEAFAYLAMRHLRGLPTSFPWTTGARKVVCGGQLVKAK